MNEPRSAPSGGWRQRFRRPFGWFDTGLDWFERFTLVACVLAMATVSVCNVIARNFLGFSLQFAVDVTQLLLVMVTFMGIGIGARQARHIRVSAIHDLLPPRARKVLLVVVGSATAALLFTLAHFGWQYAQSTQRSCRILPESIGFVPLGGMPLALGLALVLVGMVLAGHGIRGVVARAHPALAAMSKAKRQLAALAGLAVVLAVGWVAFELFIDLVESRSGRCRVTSATGFPVYVVYMVVPLGFFLGGVQFALAALRNLASRDNYLSWYHRDEYEDESQAAGQTSLGRIEDDYRSEGERDG
jgi:TRAP-type C4-dicarboxylate transport system permease small subunit